ncbi:uncharacterized protein A1O9_12457 [Exophiala aquamarina CBS 119918]|uniref:CDP-diacylglycerol-glycerol-3-phosphate 3-phosphatidyltransferase n=1 Tax=Exophiala aquamarina CBS 119918 TaxID=1182545 RepID=A0A072P7F4_9EURO|nr:uncharacterized protein A1O9_12457 [Exophiala aquamarina CBS 119918]KEF51540.1 hypothetical protein A1O9_12457 [Exophiala aquamarina CBS 119918]
MFDVPLRRVKDTYLLSLVPLVPKFVSPNHITFLAFLVGVLACVSAMIPGLAFASVYFWLFNRFLDNLDGVLARARRQATDLGGFFDLLSDFVIYSCIPISIAYGQYADHGVKWFNLSSFLAITILEATFHVNNFVLFYWAAISAKKAEGELTSLTMKPALIEGFESGVIFTLMFVWPQQIVVMSWMMSVGVGIGTLQRIIALASSLDNLEFRKNNKD